jgi:hypothetical protein
MNCVFSLLHTDKQGALGTSTSRNFKSLYDNLNEKLGEYLLVLGSKPRQI